MNGVKKVFAKIGCALRAAFAWMKAHKAVTISVSVVLVLALAAGLSLGLTLPIKSVVVKGEVVLVEGEAYTGGFVVYATNRAGRVREVAVTTDMISGFDPDVPGEQTVTVSYGKWQVPVSIKVLAFDDVTLCVRENSLPTEFEPNDAFPTSGIFDLYYNGSLVRSVPITAENAPDFTTLLSGEYAIELDYIGKFKVGYAYTVVRRVLSIEPVSGVLLAEQGARLNKDNVLGEITFRVTYNDGRSEVVSFHDAGLSVATESLAEEIGIYETQITLVYLGVEFVCPVEAYPKGAQHAVSSLVLKPGRTVYLVGETPQLSDFTVSVEYSFWIGVIELPLTAEMVRGELAAFEEPVDSFDLIIDYLGSSASVALRVIDQATADTVTSISTLWLGTPTGAPSRGEDLNFTNAEFTVTYGYGYRTQKRPLTTDLVTGYDKATPGRQTLVLSYGGKTVDIPILVKDPALADVPTEIVSIFNWRDDTFRSSEALVIPADAALYVSYGYGYRFGSVLLSDPAVTNDFVPGGVGSQTVTFRYAGLSKSCTVKVKDNTVEGLTGVSLPARFRMDPADEFDPSAVTVTLEYSEGYRTEYVSLAEAVSTLGARYSFSGEFYPEIPGTYRMSVELAGFVSNSCSVIVIGPVASNITLETDGPIRFSVGDALDPTGIHLYMNYSDGSKEEITFSAGLVEGFDTSAVGSYNKRVLYVMADRSKRRFECLFSYAVVD